MTKEEARLSVMGAISMALKDPILQQGFEIICKNLAELKKENAELKERNKELLESCEGVTMMYNDLCKAKEIIKSLMLFAEIDCREYEEAYKKAEQFLNNEVEK